MIAPEWRRKGVAAALLQYALEDCREQGYELVEAYPRRKAETDAAHYHGPPSLYEKAGFTARGGDEDSIYMARRL